jgi:hypothetical protein
VPHDSAYCQRGNARISQPLAARAPQVVRRSVLDGSACPLVGLFDNHARGLADTGNHLADPLGIKSPVAWFAPDVGL